MTINDVEVMRRRDDSWLNATQILKVAGVEKGKRTRLLEKEILPGKHEKVQGGYHKYQGTWIDFERGREYCRAYGVEEILSPLLDLDMNLPNGQDSTPTKEQAMAAKRKRMYSSNLSQSGSSGSLFPPISSTITNAYTALGKTSARVDSPHAVPSTVMTTMRSETNGHEGWPLPPAGIASEASFSQSQTMPDSAYASQILISDSQTDAHEPPLKRARTSTPMHDMLADFPQNQVDALRVALPPLDLDHIPDLENARQKLLNVFVNTDPDAVSSLGNVTPQQVDMPLDNMGNAAIHWAASLARVPVIDALISRGSSIYRVNDAGETALVRGCFCTNNFDQSSFPQLLGLLHPTISIADNNGRIILHHIALKSGMKGRSADGRYYLHCLLEFIAKHGASSQRESEAKVMNLGRFITDIVNAQDKSGDTALNIAARIGNKSIVQLLLEVGADSSIPNRAGLKPVDFGVGGEPAPITIGREPSWTIPPAVVQKREDIVKSMKEVIEGIEKDFQREIGQKQEQVSTTLNKLREVTLKLGKERERMNQLRRMLREHGELRQHCKNLRRAIEEENMRFQETFINTNGNADDVDTRDADALYSLKTSLLAPVNDIANLTTQQIEYVRSLPSAAVLKARLKGYRANEGVLKDKAVKLHDRSTDLEEKFRRVVALCTGVKEDKVDSLLEGLVQAVESDPGEVDTARVSSFLRKVDESVGGD